MLEALQLLAHGAHGGLAGVGEVRHLAGHHAEPGAMLVGVRRLDPRVEREQPERPQRGVDGLDRGVDRERRGLSGPELFGELGDALSLEDDAVEVARNAGLRVEFGAAPGLVHETPAMALGAQAIEDLPPPVGGEGLGDGVVDQRQVVRMDQVREGPAVLHEIVRVAVGEALEAVAHPHHRVVVGVVPAIEEPVDAGADARHVGDRVERGCGCHRTTLDAA